MMLKKICLILIIYINFLRVHTYTNLYTLMNLNTIDEGDYCGKFFFTQNLTEISTTRSDKMRKLTMTSRESRSPIDPLQKYGVMVDDFLFGRTFTDAGGYTIATTEEKIQLKFSKNNLLQQPTGKLMHAELFDGAPQVHMPDPVLIQRGYIKLKLTTDFMQTAVNAFFILIYGNRADILNLPPKYILNSTRTIAMMKLPRDKLAAIWEVVKDGKRTRDVTYDTLCQFRPLFKYVSAMEMSQLNLLDARILSYIGTHPDLDRHQVGVIASHYIKLNPLWAQAKYLNLMNNLLCGIPITNMRKIADTMYLQLDHQVFYHTRACDPLQRRFYLAMMTRTQALGKSYSWSARDVTRLGLLLAEVRGPDLATINPEAMVGISSEVMVEMKPENLRYITDTQLKFLEQKPLNIMSRKLKKYFDEQRANGVEGFESSLMYVCVVPLVVMFFKLIIS